MIVVISGSRTIPVLDDAVKVKIEKVVELGALIRVGDAPGVDFSVQRHLLALGYQQVEVWYCERLQNNVGQWTAVEVKGDCTDKDKAMHTGVDYGLAIWDGRSRGTARNIEQLGERVRIVQVQLLQRRK